MSKNKNLSYVHFEADEQKIIEAAYKLLSDLKGRRQVEVAKELALRAKAAVNAENNARARARYQEKRAERERIAQPHRMMAKLSLAAGDIIQVRGTRDGHGLREVKHVDGTKVVCHQLFGNGRGMSNWLRLHYQLIGKTFKSTDRTGITTRHDLKNVTHIEENGKMVKFEPFSPSEQSAD